jgi:NADPH:quinone reductase-like Zn-dependent oxidoreductase
MSTFRAIRVHRFGGPEVLDLDELPWPQPLDDEVLLKVHAASLNPVDFKMRSGKYPAVKQDQLPVVLGRDVSGTVELCGTRAHTLKKGDPIFAMLGQDRGGYAEYVVVKAVEMAAKPDSLDHVSAAAVPLAGLTAWQGLFDHGGLRPGQRVLIHGGAGGVGHFAVQFAKAKGAWVATTASERDLDFVRELGADQAINYRGERFEDVLGDKVDLVFDLIAGETQDRSWAVLKEGGMLVSTLGPPAVEKAEAHGAHGIGYLVEPNASQLGEIGRLIDSGHVRVSVERTFRLEEAGAAQDHLEGDHVRGKVVLKVADR